MKDLAKSELKSLTEKKDINEKKLKNLKKKVQNPQLKHGQEDQLLLLILLD